MSVLTKFMMKDAPAMVAGEALYPYSDALAEKYVFTSRYEDEVKLHRVSPDGKWIMLPRGLCTPGPQTKDLRQYGDPAEFPLGPAPRPHQAELFAIVGNHLAMGRSGIVSAYTGWGKTVLGYHAAATIQRKTIVITTKEDIFDQWVAGASKFLGLQPHEIGVIRGDKCEVQGTKFVVAMIQSLSKEGRYPPWIVNGFGLVIFDECHRVPADQFQNVAGMFPAMLRLGLSATPNRRDGKELLVKAHIGDVFASTEAELMVPKVLRFRTNWQCPRFYQINEKTLEKELVRMPHQAGRTARIEKIIAADPERNMLLCQMANEALQKDRATLIFSTQHEHLHALQRMLTSKFAISGRKIGFYVGATSKQEKDKREREKARPLLLTTYSMMGEGTDIDWLDTAILGMPRADVAQAAGRIRRVYEDKKDPVIMDFLDMDSPVFAGYAASRGAWYRRLGCVVKDMN